MRPFARHLVPPAVNEAGPRADRSLRTADRTATARRRAGTPPARWSTRALLAALVALAACGGDTATTAPTPSPTPSPAPSPTPTPAPSPTAGRLELSSPATSFTIASGSSERIPLAVTRVNYDGAIALSTEALPAGVTVTFEPASLAAGQSAATAIVAVTAAAVPGTAVPGTANVAVLATGTGVTGARLPLTVTVSAPAPALTLSATPNTVLVPAGRSGTSTIAIARGNGFAGPVTLATSGLPSGVGATIAPNATTAASATLSLVVSATAQAGSYPITVTGTAGTATATTTVTLTVTTETGGGSGNATLTFCDPKEYPVWFVARSSPAGAWVPIAPGQRDGRPTYAFSVTGSGGVAYAVPQTSGGMTVTVIYGSAAELTYWDLSMCAAGGPRQSLLGAITGLPTGGTEGTLSFGVVSIGGGIGNRGGNGPIEVRNAPVSITDLLAYRTIYSPATESSIVDRVVLRRNVGYTSTFPTVDFGGAEAVAPATARVTVANLGRSEWSTMLTLFGTARGIVGGFPHEVGATPTTSVRVFGVPAARLLAGDLQSVVIGVRDRASDVDWLRGVTMYQRNLIDRTAVLGAALLTPTLTSVPGAYTRHAASGSWQADYGSFASVEFREPWLGQNSWELRVGRQASGAQASTWRLEMPDFTGVPGFDPAWALPGQVSCKVSASGFSGMGPVGPVDGTVIRTASRGC